MLHHFESMVETITCVAIYRGIESFQGFLGDAGFLSSTYIMNSKVLMFQK